MHILPKIKSIFPPLLEYFPFLHSCLHINSSKLVLVFDITQSFRANLKTVFIALLLVCNTQQLLLKETAGCLTQSFSAPADTHTLLKAIR